MGSLPPRRSSEKLAHLDRDTVLAVLRAALEDDWATPEEKVDLENERDEARGELEEQKPQMAPRRGHPLWSAAGCVRFWRRPHPLPPGVPMSAVAPSTAAENAPVVDSFAVAAQIRMTTAGTTGRLMVAVPEDVKITAAEMVPALLTLGQRVLKEHRLTVQELPEVEVTEVERVAVVPPDAVATGFTVGVTNDREAQSSSIVLDSDLLLGNDGGVLLAAATLLAGAAHLLEPEPTPARKNSSSSRNRRSGSRGGRRHR